MLVACDEIGGSLCAFGTRCRAAPSASAIDGGDTVTYSRLQLCLRWLLATLLISIVVLFGSGCFLDRAGTGVPPSEFEVTPAFICPQDPISVRWDVWTADPCWTGRPTSDDTPRCSTLNSPMISNSETPFSVGLDERTGSLSYDPGPSVDTTFSMTALQFTGRASTSEGLTASVDVVEVPTAIPLIAPGVCADNGVIDVSAQVSSCVEINQICVDGSNPRGDAYVLTGHKSCLPGTPPDVCARPAFVSGELRAGECIAPSDVGVRSFQGLSTLDIDWRPSVLDPGPGDCTVEGSGFNPNLGVTLQTSCTGAHAGCNEG